MLSFQTQEQLHEFLMPVLKIRVRDLQKEGIIKTELELFQELKNIKWRHDTDLCLHEIVEDILHYKIEKQ